MSPSLTHTWWLQGLAAKTAEASDSESDSVGAPVPILYFVMGRSVRIGLNVGPSRV